MSKSIKVIIIILFGVVIFTIVCLALLPDQPDENSLGRTIVRSVFYEYDINAVSDAKITELNDTLLEIRPKYREILDNTSITTEWKDGRRFLGEAQEETDEYVSLFFLFNESYDPEKLYLYEYHGRYVNIATVPAYVKY